MSPDWTALKSVLRSARNWLLLDVVLPVEAVVLSVAPVPVDVLSLLDVPKSACRSLETALAADCEAVVSPDCTDCRRFLRSLMKLLEAVAWFD